MCSKFFFMQAHNQKSAMGGGVAGSGGGSPNHGRQLESGGKTSSHRRHRVWGSDTPALEKKVFFGKNNLILGLFC